MTKIRYVTQADPPAPISAVPARELGILRHRPSDHPLCGRYLIQPPRFLPERGEAIMDPMTALSIAAAVVQFVDFGTGLLRGSLEVYTSAFGQTRGVVHVTQVVDDLSELSKSIKEESDKMRNTESINDSTESKLLTTCADCLRTCADIRAAVAKLGKVEPRPAIDNSTLGKLEPARAFKSIQVALKNSVSSSKMNGWETQLRQAREQITTALLGTLW